MTNIGRESESVEFKENISQLEKGVKSLSAMLNRRHHGTVFFGVDDDGEVIGMDVGEYTLEKIRNAIRTDIVPLIVPVITVLEAEQGIKYVSVSAMGYDVPYSCKEKYYIRNVSSDESAGPEVLTQIVLSRGLDPLRDMQSDRQDLTFKQLFGMLVGHGFHPCNDTGYFRSIGFMDSYGSFNLCAYLMSDQNELPMQVVVFKGTDRSCISDRTDFGRGCLIRSMESISDHIVSYMETKVDTSTIERKEDPLFDILAFREAWVNACVHNAWRTLIPPSVLVFDDRIEIVSYGRIPFPISTEEFFSGDSRPVNSGLFTVFAKIGAIEQSGHGVPCIVRACGREAFHISDSGLKVTIPFRFTPRHVLLRLSNEERAKCLDNDSRRVLEYLAIHPVAKLAEVSDSMGITLSSVKKIVVNLKNKGVLRNEGTNRNAIWSVGF